MRFLLTLVTAASLSTFACGSEKPEPATPSSPARASAKKSARRVKPLSPKQVRRVMDKKALEMSGCYELSDDKEGAALETLTVEFEVGIDGKVTGERFADGESGDVLRDCVLKVVRGARFPKAGSPTDVSWPLRFRTSSQ